MVKLDYVPNGIDEINHYYGNPDSDKDLEVDEYFFEKVIKWYQLTYPLRSAWNPEVIVTKLRLHSGIATSVLDAIEWAMEMVGPLEMRKNDWDRTAGTYCFREMRGYPALSTHSWAIAIDMNSHIALWGGKAKDQPQIWIDAFKNRGWIYGGDWAPRWTGDPMHFQACRGY